MFNRIRQLISGPSELERVERYLAGAANPYDLELRQREIDRGALRRQPHRF